MRYHDTLYGEWELPWFIERLVHTREMTRLRKIAQSVMPNYLMPAGSVESRFHHGLGVCYLATLVLKNNSTLTQYSELLPIAACLHDAGNPPFSHLGERFLKDWMKKDGETFLEDMVGDEVLQILHKLGFSVGDVIGLVTGEQKPIAEILHGSLDIDNLDNVARYMQGISVGKISYHATWIAKSFRYKDGKWFLLEDAFQEAQRWQAARGAVYGYIGKAPHLAVATMLSRALEIAYAAGEIGRSFFFKDDFSAMEYLKSSCNLATKRLVERLERWQWYEEVCSFEFPRPSARIERLISSWYGRFYLANLICDRCGVAPEKVCVYFGRVKERRRIHMPILYESTGKVFYDVTSDKLVPRLKVYLVPDLVPCLKRFINDLLSYELKIL